MHHKGVTEKPDALALFFIFYIILWYSIRFMTDGNVNIKEYFDI